MTLEEAIGDFLVAVESDGRRPLTVGWYRRILKPFCNTFQGQQLDEISTAMIRQFIVGLRHRTSRYTSGQGTRPQIEGGLSEDTIATHIRALHRFWNWSVKEYQLASNPMANIRRPPRIHPDPKGVSLEDVKALFRATGEDDLGVRDRAIIAFLMDTGSRAQGLISLTPDNLELQERRAIVSEKGRPNRAIFISPIAVAFLQAWLAVRPTNAETIFCSLSAAYYSKALTYDGLKEIFRRLKRKAGIQGRVNPHSFRHGFAREYIKNGGDLATLSRLMGHADSMVTAWYYAVFTGAELAAAHDKYSPIKGLIEPEE